MSSSSKKKLRNELEAAKLTEKQLAAQKEAKKLKIYTITFVTALVLLLVIALTVGIVKTISNSGIRERNTVALTVNNETISNAEMSYFYVDFVQKYASDNAYFLSYMLDPAQPLDQQVYDPTTGMTWAEFMLASAQDNAKSIYAMSNAAKEAGFALPSDDLAVLENNMVTMEFYANMYGFSNVDNYLKAMYGKGATMESYRAYCERSALANAYYYAYAESLSYDDAALREAEKDCFEKYSSFTYHSYYMATSKFLTGGTVDENGATVYSDEETAAASAAAEEAAIALTDTSVINSVEALDLAIGRLDINSGAENPVKSTLFEDTLYTSIDADVAEWLAGDRTEGDLTYIAKTGTSTDENGETTTNVTGYYVVYFISRNDNEMPLANVRHILLNIEGGTTGENGETVYTEAEIAAAEAAAKAVLEQWTSGEATEDSFAALATEKSADTGSVANGGLYENVYPGQMVPTFDEWCFAGHKPGDTGIVKTDYGFHVMYYCGESDLTYRDYMITNALTSADVNTWYAALVDSATSVVGDNSYLPMDMTLNG